jgi:hypothetical protein
LSSYGLIVIDNDANELKESKGKDTLEEIRNKDQNIPIVYTSFQTGWVDGKVYQTNGVEVVRTDQAIDKIGDKFKLDVKDSVTAEGPESETNILLTYNRVEGYEAGVYSNGKLLILSYDKNAGIRARKVIGENLETLYGNFDWESDRELVRNIFVYDGVSGGDRPGNAASGLGHDIRMKVKLMACPCDWDRKRGFRNSRETELYKVECSGSYTLGAISDVILGVKRPGVDYGSLSIPEEKILEKAEIFRI